MLLWGETFGLKEVDYKPILMCILEDSFKKRKNNSNKKNKKKNRGNTK